MPIFRRKPSVDPAELAALRDELAGMQALLASAVASRKSVEQRLSELESAREAEEQTRLAAAERDASVPPPPPPSVSLDEVKALAEQAAQLAAQAEQGVKGLNELVASGTHAAADETAEVLVALQAQVAELAERVSATQADSRQARELATAVDVRITQLGSELTCQIDELAGEIEDVRRIATTSTTVDSSAVIEELRVGQVRLANEQARYEIAFREDLAQLADQLLRRSA
jgi:hypothetical protein